MKKIVYVVLFAFLLNICQIVSAKTFEVIGITQNDYSTAGTNNELIIKVVGNYELQANEFVSDKTILAGNIVETVAAKKGREPFAYIQFTKFKLPHQTTMTNLSTDFAIAKLSVYKNIDLGKLQNKIGNISENPTIKYIKYPVLNQNKTVDFDYTNNVNLTGKQNKSAKLNLPQGTYIILTFTDNN